MNKFPAILFLFLSFAIANISCVSAPVARYPAEPKKEVLKTGREFWDPRKMPRLWAEYSLDYRQKLDSQIQNALRQTRINNENPQNFRDLGMLLYRRCRLEEAAEAYENALKLEPSNPDNNYFLGCIYFFSKRYDLSINHITSAKKQGFKINPEINNFFHSVCPRQVDLVRAKIKLDLEKPYSKKGLSITALEDMLNLPEDEIDIATFALLVSKEASEKMYGKSIDITGYRDKLDSMVEDILTQIGGETRPEWIVSSVNNYLFTEKKYFSPVSDPTDQMIPNYNLFNYVIDYKRGICMSLAVLYLSIAERMRLPVYGVVIPSHFFVRYDDLINTINIETTAFGRTFSNDYYRKEYPNLNLSESLYFKNLNKKEAIGCYLNNFASFYIRQKKYNDAERLLKLAIKVDCMFSEPYANLGNVYSLQKKYSLAIETYNIGLKYNPRNNILLKNLGNAYFMNGEIDRAMEELKMSCAVNDKDAEVHSLLGLIYRKKGYYNEAILELKRALSFYPDNPELNYQLALAFYQVKQYDEAWKQVKLLRKQQYHVDPQFLDLLTKAKVEPVN